jgi:hypothetical protein
MMGLEDIRKDRQLIDLIDWDMTPEEAVRLYLEWGNNWSRGYRMVRTKDDKTYYFVLNTWEDSPVIYFVRRDYEGAVELARVDIPNDADDPFNEVRRLRKGVYAVQGELREWLRVQLDVN